MADDSPASFKMNGQRRRCPPHRGSGSASDADQRRPETAQEVTAAPGSPPEEAAKMEED